MCINYETNNIFLQATLVLPNLIGSLKNGFQKND